MTDDCDPILCCVFQIYPMFQLHDILSQPMHSDLSKSYEAISLVCFNSTKIDVKIITKLGVQQRKLTRISFSQMHTQLGSLRYQ
jgi:hypothetical protein